MKKKAKNNNQYRSDLLALVSHELNTPLTGIYNAIALLEERYPDEAALSILQKNAERLKQTIYAMIETSQADAGILRVRLTEASLANVILIKLQELQEKIKQAGFILEKEIEDDLPTVCADIQRIAKVLEIFVSSILDSTQKNKNQNQQDIPRLKIKVSLEPIEVIPSDLIIKSQEQQTGSVLMVSVQSSLQPSAEALALQEYLFEPFQPWRNVYNREKEGLGLDLPLAREILFSHKGYLWAKLEENVAFYFALPLLSRSDELSLVINNRLHSGAGILEDVSLLLIRPERGMLEAKQLRDFELTVNKLLFRSSDSAFMVPEVGELTIIMDDCSAESAKKVALRLLEEIQKKYVGLKFTWATATGPADGATAEELFASARSRWQSSA